MVKMTCVLPTSSARRGQWLAKAVELYKGQSMRLAGETNLIIVDEVGGDGSDYHDRDITHLWLDPMPLGEKMNVGTALASGEVIQKLDDDDYYSPDFLASSYSNLTRHGHNYVSGCHYFLSLIQHDPNLYYIAGQDSWFAGGTIAFYRSVWEHKKFQAVKSGFGKQFFEDRPQLKVCYLVDPELYVLVRHNNNTWTDFVERGEKVDDVIRVLPVYYKTVDEFMAPQHVPFYSALLNGGGR